MIQSGIEAVKQITPNTYVILLLALFVAEKVVSMTFRGVAFLRGNSKEKPEKKDDTQRIPCFQSPLFTGPWETQKRETHDTKVIADRLDDSMGKLLLESTKQTLESKIQTGEIKKQTRILEKIRQNGSSEKNES